MFRVLFRSVGPILYWSPAVIYATTQVYVPMHITGRSMQPTLNPDSSLWRDVGIFERPLLRGRNHKIGDIVALRSPANPKQLLVKRITGTEGQGVRTLPPYPDSIVRIPEGHIWVEGDEHFFSDDSNFFGPIPAALIDSKLIWILWPPSRFGPSPKAHIGTNEEAYRHAIQVIEKQRHPTQVGK